MKKTVVILVKLAVAVSTLMLLASCAFEKEHVHTIVPVGIKAATLNDAGTDPHWKCIKCKMLFKDEDGTQETTIEKLIIPRGFARISEGTVTENIGKATGPFGNATTTHVSVQAFHMAMTETTYERWYEVYTWATASERGTQQYTFANKGREGNDGTDGDAPTEARQEPVTSISWRDAVVWCNAASEMDGKTPVYYLGGTTDFTDKNNVLRESETGAGSRKADKAVINENANGYKLPTQKEWEYAARGGDPSSIEWNYKYAGINSESDVDDYIVSLQNSNKKTAKVASMQPNSAGLYDMSGNVWEWCYVTPSSGYGTCLGGSYAVGVSNAIVSSWSSTNSDSGNNTKGFRVCLASGSN